MEATRLTTRERHAMLHAIGAGRAHRNYYCTEIGSGADAMWLSLAERGLAKEGRTINDGRARYFSVTDEGRAAVGSWYECLRCQSVWEELDPDCRPDQCECGGRIERHSAERREEG